MARHRRDPVLHWIDPEDRGIIPLDSVHIPRSLRKIIKAERFTVRIDTAFEYVIRACAAPATGRESTWINDEIIALYTDLQTLGHAHSVETWLGEELVGGLYGVTLGAAFFGESMFQRTTNASKVALAYLIARLRVGGFKLLDTQFYTPHLDQFGTVEIDRTAFHKLLKASLSAQGNFYSLPSTWSGTDILQSIAQTS